MPRLRMPVTPMPCGVTTDHCQTTYWHMNVACRLQCQCQRRCTLFCRETCLKLVDLPLVYNFQVSSSVTAAAGRHVPADYTHDIMLKPTPETHALMSSEFPAVVLGKQLSQQYSPQMLVQVVDNRAATSSHLLSTSAEPPLSVHFATRGWNRPSGQQ